MLVPSALAGLGGPAARHEFVLEGAGWITAGVVVPPGEEFEAYGFGFSGSDDVQLSLAIESADGAVSGTLARFASGVAGSGFTVGAGASEGTFPEGTRYILMAGGGPGTLLVGGGLSFANEGDRTLAFRLTGWATGPQLQTTEWNFDGSDGATFQDFATGTRTFHANVATLSNAGPTSSLPVARTVLLAEGDVAFEGQSVLYGRFGFAPPCRTIRVCVPEDGVIRWTEHGVEETLPLQAAFYRRGDAASQVEIGISSTTTVGTRILASLADVEPAPFPRLGQRGGA